MALTPAQMDAKLDEHFRFEALFTSELANGWAPTGALAAAPEFFPNVQQVVQVAIGGGDIKAALTELDRKTADLLGQ